MGRHLDSYKRYSEGRKNGMLSEILRYKQEEVRHIQLSEPLSETKSRSLYKALLNPKRSIGLIAEIKKASPSKGVFQTDFHPKMIAQQYEEGGADCISVLTDEYFFKGHKSYVKEVKEVVKLPVLRKDFLIDEKQVIESKHIGADAILLIAEAVLPKQLKSLYDVAVSLDLDVLVEVHSRQTLYGVLEQFVPKMIGINNRDLTTFQTDVAKTGEIISEIPDNVLVVSESGILTKKELDLVEAFGAHAVLVGESLMRKRNQKAAIHQLFGEIFHEE